VLRLRQAATPYCALLLLLLPNAPPPNIRSDKAIELPKDLLASRATEASPDRDVVSHLIVFLWLLLVATALRVVRRSKWLGFSRS
jgi:hypothetical protein